MAESERHMVLVAKMLEWVAVAYFAGDRGPILVDAAWSDRQRKPPAIGGYVPDLFGSGAGAGQVIIGEAKTANDVENRHTRAQLAAFLGYCSTRGNAVLVLAVPWHLTRFTRQMLRNLAGIQHATAVKLVVMDGLQG